MPGRSNALRVVDCQSLATKVAIYVKEAASEDLYGLPEYARELAGKGDRQTLLAPSREVDVWLREIHAPAEALALIAKMQSSGVIEGYLPVLAAARQLKVIAERGSISSKKDAELVRSVFAVPALRALLGAHGNALGAALDTWEFGHARN